MYLILTDPFAHEQFVIWSETDEIFFYKTVILWRNLINSVKMHYVYCTYSLQPLSDILCPSLIYNQIQNNIKN